MSILVRALIVMFCLTGAAIDGAFAKGTGLPSHDTIENGKGVQWYGVYVFGKKAGYNRVSLEERADSFEIVNLLAMKINTLGSVQQIQTKSVHRFKKSDGALSFASSEYAQGSKETIRAELQVNGVDATFTKVISGETLIEQIAAPAYSLGDALLLNDLMRSGKVAVGEEVTGRHFEPLPPFSKLLSLKHSLEEIEVRVVGGVQTKVYRWKTFVPEQGVTLIQSVRADGTLLRSELVGMMSMRLESEESAKSNHEEPDVLALSLLKTNVALPTTRKVTFLNLRVRLPKAFRAIRKYVQVVRENGGEYEIQIMCPGQGFMGFVNMLTYRDEEPSQADKSPEPLIQSEHPEIVATAREVTKDAPNRREKIDALVVYVYKTLKKKYRAEMSNALDVHRNKEGDCTEHSVYFVALARAAGIPARPISGLVYTDMAGGGFGGHAWAEVWIEGLWLPVDPTMNQTIADATHIPLSEGIQKLDQLQDWWQAKEVIILDSVMEDYEDGNE